MPRARVDPPPRSVDTAEKAEAYARRLLRQAKDMERMLREFPPEDWPDSELTDRLLRLEQRIAEFREGRRTIEASEIPPS